MSTAGSGVRAAIADAARCLSSVSDTARLDAELLMAHALGVDRAALLVDQDRYGVPAGFAALVARRAAHEPVAYITGYRDFWTVRIGVGPGVLIPRPDSETLLTAAVAHCASRAPKQILDLGTGPGTLLLAALDQWPDARGLGVDASETALAHARANAARTGMAERATWRHGDWTTDITGRFDLILCNPPYIADDYVLMPDVGDYEPAQALFAGADGLDAYRTILPDVARLMAPGALALFEIGSDQRDAVRHLAAQAGFAVTCHTDLGGRDRVIACTLR